MSGPVRWTAGAALVLLTLIGFARESSTSRELTAGSHGTIPAGFGAFFDVLEALELAPRRGDPTRHDQGRPGWWVSSLGICRPRDAEQRTWEPIAWVHRGGTAVLVLPERARHERCAITSDLPIPLRRTLRAGAAPPVLSGETVRADHRLPIRRPAVFRAVREPWRVRATLADEPFVIERPLGAGRVVVVADGRFLQNRWLGERDAVLAGVDLVRTFGSPVFDEAVTARHARGALSYLGTSPALPLFVAIGVLGLMLGSHARVLPPRRLGSDAVPEPRLSDLIDSLATLYARTRPAADALHHYRAYARATLRRHFGLPVDAPTEVVAQRAEQHGAPAGVLALLRDDPLGEEATRPDDAMRALDAYLWKVTA